MDIEISYILDIPQIMTSINIDEMNWKHDVITFSDNEIWFPKENDWTIIPLKSIDLVGRKLTSSLINKIHSSSRFTHELAVDYKKRSMFGNSFVSSTMFFAGPKENIDLIRAYLLDKLGFKSNADFGNLKEEEIRLLNLLSMGIKDITLLLPLVSQDKDGLRRAFVTLQKMKMVDDYAAPTSLGIEYLEKTKSDTKSEGKLGMDVTESFEGVSNTWKYVNNFKPIHNLHKFTKKYRSSSLTGRVASEDLWQYIRGPEVNELSIEKLTEKQLCLHIQTISNASVIIEPSDNSIIINIKKILDDNENTDIRILNCLHMGITKDNDLVNIIYIDPANLKFYLKNLLQDNLIEKDRSITSKGMKMIFNDLKKEVDLHPDLNCNDLLNIEDIKIKEAKKRLFGKPGDLV